MARILKFPTAGFHKNVTDNFIRTEYDRQSNIWSKLMTKLHCLDPRNHPYFDAVALRKTGRTEKR